MSEEKRTSLLINSVVHAGPLLSAKTRRSQQPNKGYTNGVITIMEATEVYFYFIFYDPAQKR